MLTQCNVRSDVMFHVDSGLYRIHSEKLNSVCIVLSFFLFYLHVDVF